LNALDQAEKQQVAYMYKALVGTLSDIGCCAFTGSSMVTFLNSVRDLRPNGFQMFNTAEYVLLGHNAPSRQWERRIASSLIESMKEKQDSNWLNILGPDLTPELVLATLRSKPELFTVRAALIHQLLENLSGAASSLAPIGPRLVESLDSVQKKLWSESLSDFVIALHALRDCQPFLQNLCILSDGNVATGAEAAALFGSPDYDNQSKFAALLCGLPKWAGAVGPRLLPPYARICSQFIAE
jgi:hypothetical protein